MDRLLSPRSIAIVGLSADPTKHGARVLTNLRKLGYPGQVWGVNPKRPRIPGVETYESLAALPEPPDVLVCALPGDLVPDLLRQADGAGYAIVFGGGFAEAGPTGAARQADLIAAARDSGIRVLGPNSGGVIVAGTGVAMSFLTCLDRPAEHIRSGPVGLVTQSGGTGSYVHNLAYERAGGLAASISTGNEADLDLADGINALVDLDAVRVIALLLETVRDGTGFMTAVGRAHSAGKPVVVTRIGTGSLGQSLMQTHTGAMATPGRIFAGVAATLGLALAETPAEMLDVAEILAHARRPGGDRVGIVTHSGGIAILLSDLAERSGLHLPQPSAELRDRLAPLLQHGAANNPLDMGGIIGGPQRFAQVVEAFGDEYDLVLAVTSAHPPAHTPARVDSLLALGATTPTVHLWMGGDVSAEGLDALRAAARPVTEEPRAAIKALVALVGIDPVPPGDPDPSIPALPREQLTEAGAKDLLADWGLAVVRGVVTRTPVEAITAANQIGYPVVAKAIGLDLAHKTEAGAVVVDLRRAAEVEEAFGRLAEVTGQSVADVLIEEMVAGPEVIVGSVRDSTFGPMVMVGVGGVAAEVLGAVATAPAPVARSHARTMIDSLQGVRLLTHPRRGRPADLDELAQIVVRVSQAAAALPDLRELDINPLMWTEHGWKVVDATLRSDPEAATH